MRANNSEQHQLRHHNRRSVLSAAAVAAAAAVALISVPTSTAAAAAHPPHVVFLLVDDNGWAGVGYNNPNLNTPTVDALAADGVKLTAHYSTCPYIPSIMYILSCPPPLFN